MKLLKKLFKKKVDELVPKINSEKEQLVEEIRETRYELEALECEYNYASEPEAIDSVIFRMKSVNSRHSLLMKQYRSIAS
jgi:phage shock protein A